MGPDSDFEVTTSYEVWDIRILRLISQWASFDDAITARDEYLADGDTDSGDIVIMDNTGEELA